MLTPVKIKNLEDLYLCSMTPPRSNPITSGSSEKRKQSVIDNSRFTFHAFRDSACEDSLTSGQC